MTTPARRADGPTALRITAIYVALGAVWVLLSDRAVASWLGARSGGPADLTHLQTLKGLLFVGATGWVLHRVLVRCRRQLGDAEARVLEQAQAEMSRCRTLAEEAIAESAQLRTERQRLADQLRQARKMEALGRLAGGVAHDFNNIVTAIAGYGELALARLCADDPARHEIEGIRQAVDRASGLTRQLLTFSRQQSLQPGPLDLNAVLVDTTDMLARLLGARVDLVVRPEARSAQVLADRSQLEQLLLNLALNARDAMPSGGRLSLQTSAVPAGPDGRPRIALIVSDTGVGMDAATRAHLFEPFFTTKPLGEGTGFGLATVHDIVQGAGGSIACESTPGRGTTFRVEFPLLQAAPDPEAASAPETPAAGTPPGADEAQAAGPAPALGEAPAILVVDDDPHIRIVLRGQLEAEGYRVLEAANGRQALSLLRRGSIDLMLCDMLMPEKEGLETCAEVRKLHPHVPFIAMSGAADGANYLRIAAKLGAAGSLEKPFSAEELLAAVSRARVAAAPPEPATR